jgi:hypothetical protein
MAARGGAKRKPELPRPGLHDRPTLAVDADFDLLRCRGSLSAHDPVEDLARPWLLQLGHCGRGHESPASAAVRQARELRGCPFDLPCPGGKHRR